MKSRLLLLAALLAACTQTVVEPAGPTTTSTISTISTTTSTTSTTTTTTTTSTTTTVATGEAVFALTEVVFGEGGLIEITNVGEGPGSPGGYWLCTPSSCFRLSDDLEELDPRRSVWVALGDGDRLQARGEVVRIVPVRGALGPLPRDDGEMGLYASDSFEDPSAIRSFVEWGSTPHRQTALAVEAELWREGDFVEVPPDAFGMTAVRRPPTEAAHWLAQVGG